MPELHVLGVEREIGHLGVAARTNIELGVNSLKNLATLDVSDIPSGIAARSAAPLIFAGVEIVERLIHAGLVAVE